jgi:hypothetical protein
MDGAIDIGHGVQIVATADGKGIYWRHPGCRPWFFLYFKPHPRSTGHVLVAGSPQDLEHLTIQGSLACPKGCHAHGLIENGRWKPA